MESAIELNRIALQNYESLLAEAVEKMNQGTANIAVEIGEGFNLAIRIIGEGWDKRLDYRVAAYVTELQSCFDKIVREATRSATTSKDRIALKVSIEEGSSFLNIDFKEAIEKALTRMNGTQTAIVLSVGILAMAGSYTVTSIAETKSNLAAQIADETTKQELIKTLDRVSTFSRDLEAPNRKLINSMDGDDTIELPGHEESLTKEQAKAYYPRAKRSEVLQAYIDDKYIVKGIDFDSLIPVVELVKDDLHPFKAEMPIVGDQLHEFYQKLEEANANHTELEFDLLVTVKYTVKGIKAAQIVGIGEKREESEALASILTQE